jgi:hypothetical protein
VALANAPPVAVSVADWVAAHVALILFICSVVGAVSFVGALTSQWRESPWWRRGLDGTAAIALVIAAVVAFRVAAVNDETAAETQSELTALQKSGEARHLSNLQVLTLKKAVAPFAGSHATISADSTTHDAHGLAEDIFQAFYQAGWILRGRIAERPDVVDVAMAGVNPEISIGVEDVDNASPSAVAVLRAFRKLGFNPELRDEGVYPKGSISVTVGPTPVPP